MQYWFALNTQYVYMILYKTDKKKYPAIVLCNLMETHGDVFLPMA